MVNRVSAVAVALGGLAAVSVAAPVATLKPETRAAFEAYRDDTIDEFEVQAAQAPLAWAFETDDRARDLAGGEVVAGAGEADGIFEVPEGLIHHWIAAVFVPGVTLETVLSRQRVYGDYPRVYEPITSAELLEQHGNVDRVLLRLDQGSAFVHVTLDAWWRRRYVQPAPDRAYTVAVSELIQQVEDAGTPEERRLPEGEDGGYLWMGTTLFTIFERDGGIYAELQTMGLSRRFPPLLGWIAEPIARRIGRGSAERTMGELRASLVGDAAASASVFAPAPGPGGAGAWAAGQVSLNVEP